MVISVNEYIKLKLGFMIIEKSSFVLPEAARVFSRSGKNPVASRTFDSAAKRSSRFSVRDGSVFTPLGMPVPIEEVKAKGGSVVIKGWRFAEAGDDSLSVIRRIKEQMVQVEIDYENRTANLSPAGARSTFAFLMGELSRISAK